MKKKKASDLLSLDGTYEARSKIPQREETDPG